MHFIRLNPNKQKYTVLNTFAILHIHLESILIKQVIVYLSVYLFAYGQPNRKA